MLRHAVTAAITATLLVGCAHQPAPPPTEPHELANVPTTAPVAMKLPDTPAGPLDVIATVNGRPILRQQVVQPLLEANGLNILLRIAQLELVRQHAQQAGIVLSTEDIQNERTLTLAGLFKGAAAGDHEKWLDQLLQQQHMTRAEFDMVLQTNAYLRKLVQPIVNRSVTDQVLQDQFNVEYGETVQVRHIQLANMQEVAEARRRLDAGEPFEKVAQEMSRNERTGPLGGELAPFSRGREDIPQGFRDMAFSLKEGEVSDPVEAGGALHLIKLIHRFPPKAVKFEDVKQTLREDVGKRLTDQTMQQLRQQLVQEMIQSLQVGDPVLKQQFDRSLAEQQSQIRDREQIRQELVRQRQDRTPATAPTTMVVPTSTTDIPTGTPTTTADRAPTMTTTQP